MTDMPELRSVTLRVAPEQPKRVSVPDMPNFGIVPAIPPVRPPKAPATPKIVPKPAAAGPMAVPATMPKPIARLEAVAPKPAVRPASEPTVRPEVAGVKLSATAIPADPAKPPTATVRPITRLEAVMPRPAAAPAKPMAETVVGAEVAPPEPIAPPAPRTERTVPKATPEPPRLVFAVPDVEPEPHPVISPMVALGIKKQSIMPFTPKTAAAPALPEPVKTATPIPTVPTTPKSEPAAPAASEPVKTTTPIPTVPTALKSKPAAPAASEPIKTAAPIQTSKPEPVVPEPAKEPEDDKTAPRRERLWSWRVLSALLPVAGVPMAAFWSERRPERSRACLAGSLVGLSVLFVLFTAVTVLGVLGMAGYVTL